MRERGRDKGAVGGHLEGLARDLCAREEVHEEGRVLRDARRGHTREVRREDLLEELQDRCGIGLVQSVSSHAHTLARRGWDGTEAQNA